jgi:Putative adhesin
MNTVRRNTRLAVAAGVGISALLLSGCALLQPPKTMSDEATVDAAISAIEIDDNDGGVFVRGVEGATGISLERTVRYRGDRTIDETHSIDGDSLVLGGCGRNCSVKYTLEVPAGLDVSGHTENGEVDLTLVHDVDVETSNGRITLDGVTGTIRAATSNGRIEGSRLEGDGGIDVSTSNGAIDLRIDVAQDIEARTSNGPIDLVVPDATYRVNADTSNGDEDIAVPNDPSGEFTLDLSTSNGSITVESNSR